MRRARGPCDLFMELPSQPVHLSLQSPCERQTKPFPALWQPQATLQTSLRGAAHALLRQLLQLSRSTCCCSCCSYCCARSAVPVPAPAPCPRLLLRCARPCSCACASPAPAAALAVLRLSLFLCLRLRFARACCARSANAEIPVSAPCLRVS